MLPLIWSDVFDCLFLIHLKTFVFKDSIPKTIIFRDLCNCHVLIWYGTGIVNDTQFIREKPQYKGSLLVPTGISNLANASLYFIQVDIVEPQRHLDVVIRLCEEALWK